MANAGSGSLATILFLFMVQAALHKGRTFPPLDVYMEYTLSPHISMDVDGGV